MNKKDNFYFNLLKKEVASVFFKNHMISDPIKDWKGAEIVLFQEDLLAKVRATVSEKWFYTYFKNAPEKLPRIDMLNLLSEYAGQKNWSVFKSNHRNEFENVKPSKKKKHYFFLLICILPVLLWLPWNTQNKFEFCFIDDLQSEPIDSVSLDIKILKENESPIRVKTDRSGCFKYLTSEDYIRFVVKSPYHKTDTIVRFIENNKNQKVQLSADDYALMLKYYTEGNIVDWRKHKRGLENLIADEVTIYKLNGANIGVELYTKDDFVRLLTIPTASLKRVKILDKTLDNGKIVKLKFILL